MPLPSRRLSSSSAEPKGLVVLLHGYGSDAADLIGLAEAARFLLPEVAWVAPDAPLALPQGGRAWFPLARLDAEEIAVGSDAALGPLNAFLDAEADAVPAERTALVGFSQGAILALHAGLRRPGLAGIVAYSGALPAPERLGEIAHPAPPVTLIHGEADGVVPVFLSIRAEEALRAAGVRSELHLLPGVGHTVNEEGLIIGAAAILAAFAP